MNRKIVDYIIIGTEQLYCLDYFYQDIMQQNYNGFELLGAPFMKDNKLCQAMVKYEEDE